MRVCLWLQRGGAGLAVVSVLLPWVADSDPFTTIRSSGLRLAMGDSPFFFLNPYGQYAPVVLLGPAAGVLVLWRSFRAKELGRGKSRLPIVLLWVGAGLLPVGWIIGAMLAEGPRLLAFGQALTLGPGAYVNVGAFGLLAAVEMIALLLRRRAVLTRAVPSPPP